MNRTDRPGTFLLAIALAAVGVASAGNWDSYVPRKISDVIDANADIVSSEDDYLFTANNFPTKAVVHYLGEVRAIPERRSDFIARYLGKMRGHPEWVELYKHEVLCAEGGTEYWLPIQESVLEYFRKEVPANATTYVYAIWIGVIRVDNRTDWLFLVNEFAMPNAQEKG